MILANKAPKNSKVAILGLTFKENCPDTRNSKVEDIIKALNNYGIEPIIVDPWASEADAMKEYGVKLTKLSDVHNLDCIILAVAHDEFKKLDINKLNNLYKDNEEKVLIDVKSILNKKELENLGIRCWRL